MRGFKIKKPQLKRILIGAAIGAGAAFAASYGAAMLQAQGAPVPILDVFARAAIGGAIGGTVGAMAAKDDKRVLVTAALGGLAGTTVTSIVRRATSTA